MSETKQAETRADGLKQFRQWRAENPNLVAYPDVCFCAGVLAGREHERRITAKEIADWLDYANEAVLLPADKYKCVKKLAESIREKYEVK